MYECQRQKEEQTYCLRNWVLLADICQGTTSHLGSTSPETYLGSVIILSLPWHKLGEYHQFNCHPEHINLWYITSIVEQRLEQTTVSSL